MELEYTSTYPTEPGYYWIKSTNLSERISKFCFSSKKQKIVPYRLDVTQSLYREGMVYAGPIPKPIN